MNLRKVICDMLIRIKKTGYSEMLLDMDEEEKVTALSVHSGKLAIALGLMSTYHGVPSRIVKNLCVCKDCEQQK